MKAQDLTVRKFNRLTPREWIPGRREDGRKIHGKWRCDCKCGNVAFAATDALVSGRQVSCGCFNRELKRGGRNPRSKQLVARAVAEYAAGRGGKATAGRFGVSLSTLLHWVRRTGGHVRTVSEAKRLYSLNERAFSTLTDDAAYWLGFLLADGCVHTARPRLTLALKPGDASHVAAFAQFLGTTRPIIQTAVAAILSVDSPLLIADLARYGVVPCKSLTAAVSAELFNNSHFFRGLVDGDGSVAWTTPGRGGVAYPLVALSGSRAVCESFARFIHQTNPTHQPSVAPDKNIWRVRLAGRSAARLARVLYSGGISLPRKQAAADSFSRSAGLG